MWSNSSLAVSSEQLTIVMGSSWLLKLLTSLLYELLPGQLHLWQILQECCAVRGPHGHAAGPDDTQVISGVHKQVICCA